MDLTIGGLDLSLTSTGLAVIQPGKPVLAWAYRPPGTGYDRLDSITGYVLSRLATCDLIVVEGLAFGARGRAVFDIGGLWWHVTWALHRNGQALVVVPPATVKKYATGRGNADKVAVAVAAAKRMPDVELGGHDTADALWLAAMAADRYGFPVAEMPKAQRDVLDGLNAKGPHKGQPVVRWPDAGDLRG